jgi:Uma2 family endonuclease
MRAILLDVPGWFLDEQRRRGVDRWDELWDGVLHVPPMPNGVHQRFGSKLLMTLKPIVDDMRAVVTYTTGLFRADDDYRTPDLVVSRPEQRTQRGVEGGAELVVEILSPGDESHEKLSWYAAFPVRETLLVDPDTRAFELIRGGKLHAVLPDADGRVRSDVLGVTFATRPGPRLEVVTAGGTSLL